MRHLPSAPTWSLPPRPWTSHVRAIAPSHTDPNLVVAGIELGGVVRSTDSGETWQDQRPGAQADCHALAAHPAAPWLQYEAGGEFAQSPRAAKHRPRRPRPLSDILVPISGLLLIRLGPGWFGLRFAASAKTRAGTRSPITATATRINRNTANGLIVILLLRAGGLPWAASRARGGARIQLAALEQPPKTLP